MPDYYALLQVAPTASRDEIHAAYWRLAKRYHPDKNPGDVSAARRMKQINAAWDILRDAERRRQYDSGRQAAQEQAQRAREAQAQREASTRREAEAARAAQARREQVRREQERQEQERREEEESRRRAAAERQSQQWRPAASGPAAPSAATRIRAPFPERVKAGLALLLCEGLVCGAIAALFSAPECVLIPLFHSVIPQPDSVFGILIGGVLLIVSIPIFLALCVAAVIAAIVVFVFGIGMGLPLGWMVITGAATADTVFEAFWESLQGLLKRLT
jgi:hypothetical protein